MATGNTTRIGPWPAGMNNRQPDHALPDGTLRNAVNVDIDNRGKLRRRKGITKIAGAVNAHSGYGCPLGEFYVDGARLMRLNPDNTVVAVCAVSGGPMAYEYFDGVLYFSDGVATRKLLADGTLMPWGFDVPPAPMLGTAPGLLPAGVYLAACTYVTPDGIEHGSSDYASIELAAPGSIVFSKLPLRSDATLRLYLSTANGKTLYHVGDATLATFTVLAEPGAGMALDKQGISAPPSGSIVRQYKGRMYVADGKILWYSEPFAFSHFRLAKGFVPFESQIAVLEPVTAGAWVVTERKTNLLQGDTADTPSLIEVADYGAIPGTGLNDANDGNAYWYSTRGAVIGTQDGQIVNIQEANVATDTGVRGAAVLREQDGLKQYVASVQDSNVSPLAASSFIAMEVVRKAG